MRLSICTGTHEHGLVGWKNIETKTFSEIESAIKTFNYAAFGEMKNGYKKADNVLSMSNCAMFDIDNDPNTSHLLIKEAKDLLSDFTFVIVTSRSHQLIKGDKSAVDRYRIIVPLTNGLTPKKERYRLEMMILAKHLGLLDYVDHKALKDIARFYFKSPNTAEFIINNTGTAFNVDHIIGAAITEISLVEKRKQEARDAIRDRIIPGVVSEINSSDYPKIIDINAINSLPLDEIYSAYTGNRLSEEGSYLVGKGITQQTSQKGQSFTVWQDGNDWLWHDFKTSESGNVLTFMRLAVGMNAFEAAKELQKKYRRELLIDNPAYYAQKINNALDLATNDKSLQEQLKLAVGADFIKIDKDRVRIADKTFTFAQLGINKGDMINRLRTNRAKNSDESNDLR